MEINYLSELEMKIIAFWDEAPSIFWAVGDFDLRIATISPIWGKIAFLKRSINALKQRRDALGSHQPWL